MTSYVVWANKGGIGKSTLTFQLSSKYARENPERNVFIIDLSPQCDVSRMVLGGGHFNGEEKIIQIMQTGRPTIYRYLQECINDVPTGGGWPDATQFVIKPSSFRDAGTEPLPNNLNLVCGDFDLERITHLLDGLQQPPSRGGRVPTGAFYSSFLLARSFVKKLVKDIEDEYSDAVVFIDTDPYYSVVTTHLGLLAADNLISAYSPSSQASQYAIYRSLEFLYEPASSLSRDVFTQKGSYPQPWYDSRDNVIEAPDVNVPDLYLLVGNMYTPHSGGGESYSKPQKLHEQAFDGVDYRVRETLSRIGKSIKYEHDYIWDLKRLGLVCDYNGFDLSAIELGGKYPQPDNTDRYYVNATGGTPVQLSAYNERIIDVVSKL